MEDTIPKKRDFLVPSLPLIEEVADKARATDVIEFLAKQRHDSKGNGPTYKVKVQRFNDGTVSEWIAVRKSIKELWAQNNITAQEDRIANVCSILRGESLTGFEEKIEELTNVTNDDGTTDTIEVTEEIVEEGLNAVAKTTFPHRALETQKLWMRRGMKKPKELSFRKTAAAVGRLNNCLPLFPGGSESDKFTTTEIVELLEWSIPKAWRTKFDLDGYVPTNHAKDRLIAECKAIERNSPKLTPSDKPAKSPVHKKNRGSVKHSRGDTKSKDGKSYYCSEHGKNPTHNTEQCYVIKNKAAKANGSTGKTMTKQSFRREINMMAKKSSKKKILEMFATVIHDEHKKMSKSNKTKTSKSKKSKVSSDSSDSEEASASSNENHQMDIDDSVKKNETDEEQTYRRSIENLGTVTESK
jgi:hypothetical protein